MEIRPDVPLITRDPDSQTCAIEQQGYRRTAVWKINFLAYGAGLLYLVVTGLLLVFISIPGITRDIVVVPFSLEAPDADNVSLVGDFNKWSPDSLRMKKSDGIWKINIILKKRKVYMYNFIIDGKEWITDPDRPNTIDDGFGGRNSVLEL